MPSDLSVLVIYLWKVIYVSMTVSSTSQGSAYSCIRIIDVALNLGVRSQTVHLLYIF